ncbi:MAG TPA: hypothetical protein VGM03_11300 [Phycisphaerae bacterium]
MLDQIRIAAPCTASWAEMTGDDRVRFCAQCKLHIYNLSAMTRQESEELIRNQEGRLCVGFYRRADGTILTANCPVGLRAARRRLAKLVAAFGGVIALLAEGIAVLGSSGRATGTVRLRTMQPFAIGLAPPPPPPVVPTKSQVLQLGMFLP